MKKIMIVEDEAVIALRLEQQLIEMGYEVIGMSHTGEDGVKKARSLLPDLILMDVMISGELETALKGIALSEKELNQRKLSLEKVNRELLETNQAVFVLARNIDKKKEALEKSVERIKA